MSAMPSIFLVAVYILMLLLSLGISVLSMFGGGIGYWNRNDQPGRLFKIPPSVGILSFSLFVMLLIGGVYFVGQI